MSADHSRRNSTVPFANPGSVPTAPPLPAPRPLQRARDAASRIFGYSSRPASPPGGPAGFVPGGFGRRAILGATQNANASHKTGLEINTIAINERGTHALLGGKEIFKTIRIEDGQCTEDLNLRSAIRSTPTQASGRTRQIYSIDIADVAWAKGDCGDYVAAATSSGKIILYDVGHAGIQAAQLHEHFRQVHKVTFNPHRGSLLLSGSQDGTVRLWDVRDVRQAQSAVQSKRKYSGQSDGVRDVKWSPTEGVDFAFGTDSGWIQRWDMRNLKQAKVKIPAHSLAVNAIDWHADGKHIASASLDKTVRVWDFSTTKRQQKASWELVTPYPVFNARWRPACDNGSVRYCTQIVTSYDNEHPIMHLWDMRRPALPFREMAPHLNAPNDFIWHSQDLLWTVGKEGAFLQNDIQHAPKVIGRRNLQAFDVSVQGELNFVTQKRNLYRTPTRRQRDVNNTTDASPLMSRHPSVSDNQSLINTEIQDHSYLSRSWADDSLDSDFLTSTPRVTAPSDKGYSIPQPNIVKSRTQSLSMPPPTVFTVSPLDEIIFQAHSHRPNQHMWTGPAPGAQDPRVFEHLAKGYKIDLNDAENGDDFLTAYEGILAHNAEVAQSAGLYQLAQTWRILSFSTINHLKERLGAISEDERPAKPLSLGAVRASKEIDVETGKVFELVAMVKQLIDYYAGKGNGQMSSAVALLLSPVLPHTRPLPSAEANVTVDMYVAIYSNAGFTPEKIESIVDDKLQPLLRAGLQPMQIEAVLSAYHEQLVRHQLFGEAAELRMAAYPSFPAVYENAIRDNTISLSCDCGSEIVQGREKLKCEHCGMKQAACAICWLATSPYAPEGSVGKTLIRTACLRCGHSAHDVCLREFWSDPESEGACPTPGCLCDCVDGRRRAEMEQEAQMAKEKGEERVRKDEWAAGPSKAVDEAVGALSLRDKK